MMIQNDVRTYTASNAFFFIAPITSDANNTTSENLWMNEIPASISRLVFWSPELIDEEALPPNNPIWEEIDSMLEEIWADSDYIELKRNRQLYSDMEEIERLAEMKRFETLYGDIDTWE